MAAAHSAHPSGWTSLTPGPPPSLSLPPFFGLHLHASGLAARNPAPPEPRLLLVTVGCPSERRAPAAPRPGRYFPFRWGVGGGGRGKGKGGRRPGKGVGAWRGHPAELGSPGSVQRKRDCARSGSWRGRDGSGGRTRPLRDCAVPARQPGRRCPWMRPPRAPGPVSVPAARARPALVPGPPRRR